MAASTWVAMLVICGIVWGGFALLLLRAIRCEARKHTDPIPSSRA